ncbi:hypothetical protein [Clostridium sp.]|uniref:ParM/StbA family protein n=1 Tax=Clostridium sp. TaxID=1506 RepID=UPI00399182C4
MNLGIDIGNYSLKTMFGVNIEAKVQEDTGILTTSPIIKYANKEFVLGEGEFDGGYRKVKKENYLYFLYSTIVLSTSDINNKIILGLPISQFKADKEELTNLVMQNSVMEGSLGKEARKVIIEDVEVLPEGVLATRDDFEGIVLDIGGRTTDICLITNDGYSRKIENPLSEAIGTINLYSDFIKSLNRNYSLDLKIKDAERILRSGLRINGVATSIEKEMNVFKHYVNKIISLIRTEFNGSETLDIALVGGGSKLLKNPLISRLPNSFLVEDSANANVRAYQEVANELWQR